MAKKHKGDAVAVAEHLKEVIAKSPKGTKSVVIEVCTDIIIAYAKSATPKSLKKLKRIIGTNSYDKVKIGSPAVRPSKGRRKQIESAVKSVMKKDSAKPSKKKRQD